MNRTLTENSNNDSIVIWSGESTFKIPSQLQGFYVVINNQQSGLYRLIFKMDNGYENMDRPLTEFDFDGICSHNSNYGFCYDSDSCIGYYSGSGSGSRDGDGDGYGWNVGFDYSSSYSSNKNNPMR